MLRHRSATPNPKRRRDFLHVFDLTRAFGRARARDKKAWDSVQKNIDSGLSTNIRASILINVIRKEVRHILPIAGAGDRPNGGRHGARRNGECVSTIRFYSGLGKINCKACVSAAVERRAIAAARRTGSHHCLPYDDLRRRGGAGARAAPTSHARRAPSHRSARRRACRRA
jgi:hypothetical protein